MTAAWYRWEGSDLLLQVQLQPRASTNAVVGPIGAHLKIRLTAPPVEGRANAELIALLARECAVPRSQVEIVRGDSARRKLLRVRAPRRLPPGVSAPAGSA